MQDPIRKHLTVCVLKLIFQNPHLTNLGNIMLMSAYILHFEKEKKRVLITAISF